MRKLLLSLTCLLGVIITSKATNYYVSNTLDDGTPGSESLRDFIENGSFDDCSMSDSIILDPAMMGGNVITLGSDIYYYAAAHLVARDDVTIDLNGHKIDYSFQFMCARPKGEEAKTASGSNGVSFNYIRFENGMPAIENNGGGLLCVHSCVFENNNGAGAISVANGRLDIYDTDFIGNSGVSSGAVLIGASENHIINNCTFDGNTGSTGAGAIFINAGNLNLRDCAFNANRGDNAAAILWGGNGTSNVFDNCSFENHSVANGPVVFFKPSAGQAHVTYNKLTFSNNQLLALEQNGGAEFVMADCDFINNTGQSSGAVYVHNIVEVEAELWLARCYFEANVGDQGGAVRLEFNSSVPEVYFDDCTFSKNDLNAASATPFGGAVYIDQQTGYFGNCTFYENGNASASHGGAIYTLQGVDVKFSTFTRNGANTAGGAIYLTDGFFSYIQASIVVDNEGAAQGRDIYLDGGASLYSNGENYIVDVFGAGYDATGDFYPGNGNYENPGLESGAPVDHGGSVPTIALSPCAHAINRSILSLPPSGLETSANGVARPAFGVMDIGAYEEGTNTAPSGNILTTSFALTQNDTIYPFADFTYSNDCMENTTVEIEMIGEDGGDALLDPATAIPSSTLGLLAAGGVTLSTGDPSYIGDIQAYVRSFGFYTNESVPTGNLRTLEIRLIETGHTTTTPASVSVQMLVAPTISDIAPLGFGSEFGVDDSVAVTGTSFDSVETILWGALPITEFSIISDNEIRLMVPDVNEPGQLTITSPYGSAMSTTGSLLLAQPFVTQIKPSGSHYSGDTIRLNGSYLGGLDSVLINGIKAQVVTDSSTTSSVWAIVPVTSSGSHNAFVYTAGGDNGGYPISILANDLVVTDIDYSVYPCGGDTVWVTYQYFGQPTPGLEIIGYQVNTALADTTIMSFGSNLIAGMGAIDSFAIVFQDPSPLDHYIDIVIRTSDELHTAYPFYNYVDYIPWQPTIFGSDTACVGNSITLNMKVPLANKAAKLSKTAAPTADTLIGYYQEWTVSSDGVFQTATIGADVHNVDIIFNNPGTYEVYLKDSTQCGASPLDTFTIEILSVPSVGAITVDYEDVCGFDTTLIDVSTPDVTVTDVFWDTPSIGFIQSTTDPLDYEFVGTDAETGTYLKYQLYNVCGYSTYDSIYVENFEGLDMFTAGTIGGSNGFCVGQELDITQVMNGGPDPSGTRPVVVYSSVNGFDRTDSITGGATGATIRWNSTQTIESLYIDSAVDANGCVFHIDYSETVNTNSPVVIDSVVWTDVTCIGDSDGTAQIYYTLIDAGTESVSWAADAGGFDVTGPTSVTGLAYFEDGYFVSVLQNGCYSDTTFDIGRGDSVTAPEFVLSGPDTICYGETAGFSIDSPLNGGATPSYDWFVNGVPAATGLNYSTDTLSYGDVIQSRMTSSYVCSRPVDSLISKGVEVLLLAYPAIVSSTFEEYCTGDSAIISAGRGSSFPEWEESVDGATWLETTQSTGQNSVTVAYTNPTILNDTMYLRARFTSSCDTSYSDTVMVIVQANTEAGILLGSDVCPGDSTPLYLTGGNGDQFTWYERAQGQSVWNLMAAVTSDSTNVSPSSDYEYKVEVARTGSLCAIDSAVTPVGITAFISAGSLDQNTIEYCTGDTMDLTVNASIGTVTWFVDGALYMGLVDDTIASLHMVNAGAQNDTSYVYARITSTCDTVFTDSAMVIVNPQAVAGTSLGYTACEGGDVTITMTALTGDLFQWIDDLDAPIIGETSNSLLLTDVTTSTSVKLISTFGVGLCEADTSASVAVTINARPIIDLTLISAGDTAICFGDTSTYQLDVTQGALPLNYYMAVGSELYTGVLANSTGTIELMGVGSGVQAITFDSIVDVNQCRTDGHQSNPSSLEVLDLPVLLLDSIVDESCDGYNDGAVFVTVTHSETVNYNWSDGSINEDLTAVHDSLFNLQVVDVFGCHIDTNFTVAQGAPTIAPAIMMIGVDTLCAGDSSLFTVNVVNEGADPIYDWFINGQPQVSDTNQFMYTNPLDGEVVSVVIEVLENCAVPDTAVDSLVIAVNAPPALPVIVGNANPLCNTIGEPYHVTPVLGETYDWNSTTGAVVLNATTDSAFIDVVTEGAEQISVVATSVEGCVADTVAFDFTVANCGPEASFVQSADTVCPGSSIQFVSTSLYVQGAETYQWIIDGVDAGVDNDTLDFAFADAGLFDVQLIVTENAVSDTVTEVSAVQVDSLPTVSISGIVASPICVTDVNTYTAVFNHADSVVWSGTAVANISNATAANADIELAQTSEIIATATNICGADADTVDVEVVQLIDQSLIQGPIEVCENTSDINFSFNASLNADSVNWFASNATIRSQSDSSLSLDFGSNTAQIEVLSYNLCGVDTSRLDVEIGLLREPVFVTIDTICPGQISQLAVVSGYDSYQWQKDGLNMGGEITNQISVAEVGEYHVVISAGGCVGTSDTASVREYGPNTIVPFAESEIVSCKDSTVVIDLDGYSSSSFTFTMRLLNPSTFETVDVLALDLNDTTYATDSSAYFVIDVLRNSDQCLFFDTLTVSILPGFELNPDAIDVQNNGVEIALNLTDNDYQYASQLEIIGYSNIRPNAPDTIYINPDKLSLTYVPDSSFSGTDNLTYYVVNTLCPLGDTAEANVVLLINPVAVTDFANVSLEDSVVQVVQDLSLLLNDLGDFDEDSLFIQTFETVRGGVVLIDTVSGIISIAYPSVASDSLLGQDVIEIIEYRAVDKEGNIAIGQLEVTVRFPAQRFTVDELTEDVIDSIIPKIYNLVTPNRDGVNEEFLMELYYQDERIFPDSNRLRIFNKWGDIVYSNDFYQQSDEDVFTGLNDDGQELPEGTYYYILEFVYTNDDSEFKKTTLSGYIQLIR